MLSIPPPPFLLPLLLLLQLTATLLLLLFNFRHCSTLLSNCFRGFSRSQLSDWFRLRFGIRKMPLKGATLQACAACKYQRRKCTAECPLAPYFPADQPKMYQNAHKLFGVCNILKILKNLDPRQKVEAMRSIIYQANLRDKFPVYGCCEVIWQLQYQILVAEEELQAVHQQLAMYRHHHQHQISSMPEYVTSPLDLGMAPPNNPLALFDHNLPPCILTDNNNATAVAPVNQHQQQSYSNSSDAVYSSAAYNSDSKDNVNNNNNAGNTFMTNNSNNNNDNNSEVVQSELGALQRLSIQPQVVQDYDELHPFFDTADDRQSYIDSKEAYDSSSEESFKDTTQSMEHAENALKNDAACFSLTSVN